MSNAPSTSTTSLPNASAPTSEIRQDPPAPANPENPSEEVLVAKGWNKLLFSVHVSQRYHDKRESFCDKVDRLVTIVNLLGGSTAFGTIATIVPAWIGGTGAIATVVLTFCQLVFDPRGKATNAKALRERWVELERRMCLIEQPTRSNLAAMKSERLAIEKDEPPVLRNLALLCHNEELKAVGITDAEYQAKVSWWQWAWSRLRDVGDPIVPPPAPAIEY